MANIKLYVVISDKTDKGTSYVYGPFLNTTKQREFADTWRNTGRIIHCVNSMAFIQPN